VSVQSTVLIGMHMRNMAR